MGIDKIFDSVVYRFINPSIGRLDLGEPPSTPEQTRSFLNWLSGTMNNAAKGREIISADFTTESATNTRIGNLLNCRFQLSDKKTTVDVTLLCTAPDSEIAEADKSAIASGNLEKAYGVRGRDLTRLFKFPGAIQTRSPAVGVITISQKDGARWKGTASKLAELTRESWELIKVTNEKGNVELRLITNRMPVGSARLEDDDAFLVPAHKIKLLQSLLENATLTSGRFCLNLEEWNRSLESESL